MHNRAEQYSLVKFQKFPRMKSSPGEFGYQEQHEAQEMKRVVSPRSLPVCIFFVYATQCVHESCCRNY